MQRMMIVKGRNGKEAQAKWSGSFILVKDGEKWLPINWRDFGGEAHTLSEWMED